MAARQKCVIIDQFRSSFSKVFEKVVYDRLYYHIKFNNVLTNKQYGCRNNSSIEIAS
jgi:hypothetical protein